MSGMHAIGSSTVNRWLVSDSHVDFVRPVEAPRPVQVRARPQDVRFDAGRTVLIVVDMQNDFCHPDGWLASLDVDVAPARRPIEPIGRVLRSCRDNGIPVIWVNWGNRPDRLNLGPSTHHVYNPTGGGVGLGDRLENGATVLQYGSWSAAIVDEFGDTSGDVHVAKYSMSGFWDTPLDSILRNLGVTTLLFAGVNLDQCVLCTLQDASFRGYDCVLLEDCCATTSPDYCAEATLYNVRQCFGFVTDGASLVTALGSGPSMLDDAGLERFVATRSIAIDLPITAAELPAVVAAARVVATQAAIVMAFAPATDPTLESAR